MRSFPGAPHGGIATERESRRDSALTTPRLLPPGGKKISVVKAESRQVVCTPVTSGGLPECSRWNCRDLTLNRNIKKVNSGGSSSQCACQWRSQGLLTLAHAPVITTAESSVAPPLKEHSLSFSLRRQRQRNSASGLLAPTAVTGLAGRSKTSSICCLF